MPDLNSEWSIFFAAPAGVARFLEGRGLAAEALAIATDPDYKFELAVQLGDLATAQVRFSHVDTRYRLLGS